MEKEKFNIDLTIGKRKFDTSRQSEWTKEEWDTWLDPEDNEELAFDLLNDNTLYLRVSSIYYNESNHHMFVILEVHNKFEQDILLESGKWKVDETLFEAPNMLPAYLKAKERNAAIEGNVAYMFMQSTLYMEFSIYEALTKKPLRTLAFNVKVFPS